MAAPFSRKEVTADAMRCHRQTARQVVAPGGDCALARQGRRCLPGNSLETRYCRLSHDWPPERCNDIVRGFWEIANRLHWVRDVTGNEDQARNRKGYGAENRALLRKPALNLARPEPGEGSRRGKLKRAGWDDRFLSNFLSQFANIRMR